ncbi:hypothetical protein ACS0TY_014275 [Phlomoides rotata]
MWDQEHNFVHATVDQWKAWREVYPMSRAYIFQGEPLFTKLKTLFGPEDDDDGTGPILIVDSDEEGHPHYQEEVVHALPAQAPDAPLIPKLVIISFDSDNDDIYDMLDSNVELNFTTDEEVNALEVVVSDPVAEVIDGFLNSDDEVTLLIKVCQVSPKLNSTTMMLLCHETPTISVMVSLPAMIHEFLKNRQYAVSNTPRGRVRMGFARDLPPPQFQKKNWIRVSGFGYAYPGEGICVS